jgi:carbamoyl-phosphate synthase/aspartate carbamoyltransferase/dihydroorotase
MLELPGLIDPHVHVREPGATHKEDWDTATQAALAGGFTVILAMPNTSPPILDRRTLDLGLASAKKAAHCDYAQYLGASISNADWDAHPKLPQSAAGLKMYLDSTYGELRLDDLQRWMQHFAAFPKNLPIVVHAEKRTMAAAILMAELYDRPVHIAHVSLREEILLIKKAKERGIPITCEVTPHHLFLTNPPPLIGEAKGGKGGGRTEVRPRLASQADVDALWENLNVIDCFATDHAPHTAAEKDGENPPPGFPGLETALPLLLTAVKESRLTLDTLIEKMYTNPRRIFRIPAQAETWIEVDENAKYEIRAAEQFTKCGWTPFEGWQVQGRVRRVVLRGEDVYKDGKILAQNGFGRNIR